MSDDPADAIAAAIRSAFVGYPKEGDSDWRSPGLDYARGMRALDQRDHAGVGSERLPDRETATGHRIVKIARVSPMRGGWRQHGAVEASV